MAPPTRALSRAEITARREAIAADLDRFRAATAAAPIVRLNGGPDPGKAPLPVTGAGIQAPARLRPVGPTEWLADSYCTDPSLARRGGAARVYAGRRIRAMRARHPDIARMAAKVVRARVSEIRPAGAKKIPKGRILDVILAGLRSR